MRDDSKRHGHFSLNELLTTDLASAKEFYGELLGSLCDCKQNFRPVCSLVAWSLGTVRTAQLAVAR